MKGFSLKVFIMSRTEYQRIQDSFSDPKSDLYGDNIQSWITGSYDDSFEGDFFEFYKPFTEDLSFEPTSKSEAMLKSEYDILDEYISSIRDLSDDTVILYRYGEIDGDFITTDSQVSIDECSDFIIANLPLPGGENNYLEDVVFMGQYEDEWESLMDDGSTEISYSFYIVKDNNESDLTD